MDVIKWKAPKYLWPHIDWGNSQAFSPNPNYSHGNIIEHEGRKGVFRLVDCDYEKQWLADNLPAMKSWWEENKEEWCKVNFQQK